MKPSPRFQQLLAPVHLSVLIILLSITLACDFFYGEGETLPSIQQEITQQANTPQGAIPQEKTSTGAVYYISPTGNDASLGSETQPWRTLGKAAQSLAAGDTVYIKAGTYNERLVPQNSGSAAAGYITYAAYSGDMVIVDGQGISITEEEGLVELSDCSYIEISGLRVINSSGAGILANHCDHIVIDKNYTYNTASSGIGVWSSQHITIDGNEVELANNDGEQENITVAISGFFEIKNNHVHHGGPGSNGGEGIDVKDGSHDGKVYGNQVHDLNRLGIYVDAWDKHTYNIEVYGNLVHDVAADGFMLSSEMGGLLENVWVYNNIAYHNKWVGIDVSNCCIESHPMRDIYIINNTLYNNGWEEWGGGIGLDNAQAQNVVVRNNIVSQNLYFQIAVSPSVPAAQYTIEHNLVDGFRDTEGETRGDAFVTGDPDFLNASGADFHLGPGSPAIDAGSAVDAPTIDFDGNLRPQDGNQDGNAAHDIGAYEVAGATTQSRYVYLPVVVRGAG